MGKNTPSAPQATNPTQVAQAQTQSNLNTAIGSSILNNTNQVTPAGNLTYTSAGTTNIGGNDVPQWTATTTLSPQQQAIFDSQQSVTGKTYDLANQYADRIAQATAQPYSYDSLGPAPTYDANSANKATQTLIDRNQPQQSADLASLQQRLADQGISVNDPAYQNAMRSYNSGVNDFRLGAENQGQQYAMNDYSTSENAYQNAIAQYSNLRSQPINEVSALLGTGGVQNPSFVNTPQSQVAPTDVEGAYNSSAAQQQAAYQAQLQSSNATTGGLFGLGGTVLGNGLRYGLPLLAAGSDIRMKDNVRHIGHTRDGQRLYFFTYKDDPGTPHVGLMAQDVERIKPDAVFEIDGMKYVDYGKALADA